MGNASSSASLALLLVACGSPAAAPDAAPADARVGADSSIGADSSVDASVTTDAGPAPATDPTPGPFEGRWRGIRTYHHPAGSNGTTGTAEVSAGDGHIRIDFRQNDFTDAGIQEVTYCSFTALRSELRLSITEGWCNEDDLTPRGSGQIVFDRGEGALTDGVFAFTAWGTNAGGASVRFEYTEADPL